MKDDGCKEISRRWQPIQSSKQAVAFCFAMKAVPSATHHRKRVALIIFAFCLVLFAIYTYGTVSSRASQGVQWRYYGPARETKNTNLGPAIDVPRAEDVPSHTLAPSYGSKRHLVSRNQVRPILATMSPNADCSSTLSPPKLILLWTSFFDSWNYFHPERFEHCPSCTNCNVTTDRSRLLESDAVIFHCRDMTILDLPHLRLPHQRWVFYCLESPSYSDFSGMDFMHNMFNCTMTYRYDSDVVVPYGELRKVTPDRAWNKTSLLEVWKKKTKSAIWMTSHCPTYGNRELYVKHLKKYMDVDIYGSCGTLVCARDGTHECFQKFAEKYKFYLAFENSICKDYVTEKFFRTFNYDIIPVVFGGANYENHAPRGSYIDALSFDSPKHLASFLSGVGSDFALYSAYFRWREGFVVNLNTGGECGMCDLLHSRAAQKAIYGNLRDWWVRKGQCRTYDG